MVQKEKDKWMKVLVADMMTSEESESENDVIAVKPLLWRAESVSMFLHRLDEKMEEHKSTQARRQRKRRVESCVCSLRLKPVGVNIPDWAVVKTIT